MNAANPRPICSTCGQAWCWWDNEFDVWSKWCSINCRDESRKSMRPKAPKCPCCPRDCARDNQGGYFKFCSIYCRDNFDSPPQGTPLCVICNKPAFLDTRNGKGRFAPGCCKTHTDLANNRATNQTTGLCVICKKPAFLDRSGKFAPGCCKYHTDLANNQATRKY